MPFRKYPLVTGEVYHVFNRGIDRKTTFIDKREYERAVQTIDFYRFATPPVKLSRFLSMSTEDQERVIKNLKQSDDKLVSIISFCLMPNHYHFLLKQLVDRGIANFISQLQNSFTRYFNAKHERIGPLFLDQFKAVRIETDDQLIHVNRYIHLNPYTSYVVKDLESLKKYPWSSFLEYLENEINGICDKELVYFFFKKRSQYKKFIFDQADYQRKIDKIKHLTID